ncbi:hypothetical protein [Glycomyces harbinensis]|uniref:Uncharacterized protein n=1 Tax=Glycomyces harbinensis TaxID=58114 RepID=A0A1G6W163_9ACTN|nr:hypothetical protein [Glycomyces harbinensis]SDD59581.1 hypothetical protein SAMN05216270_105248 [Glycomyces harbinensis]
MSSLLSAASRICIVILVIGGFVVTFTQVVGILLGNADMVVFGGTTLFQPVCVVAGLAGVFAFLRMYTRDGRADVARDDIDTDEA